MLACDFFSVETIRLQVLWVLVFIDLHTRRVFVAGCTEHASAAWVSQQARNLGWILDEDGLRPSLLLRDWDATFPPSFDAVFAGDGVRVVRTSVRAPRANAVAERWADTVRRECLDWLLILAGATSRPSYGSSSRTTTRPGRTARSTCARHWPADSPSTRPGRSSDRIGSVDSSTSTSVLPRERYRPSKGTPQPPNGGRNARRWGPTRPSPQAVGTGR